ncbi:hypothetical protein ABZZ79_15430 [Streptomyces sp. NPDC006458]|uniref:hypothetical protein n=1 Tax=Streptomyces sp. NPDC006458 TaxID=3154302 RepID=UPI0033B54252
MSLTLVRDTSALEQRVALIACGARPGKTEACGDHQEKAAAFLTIASTGAADALAAAICGHRGTCRPCTT